MKLRSVLSLFLGALALLTPFIPNALHAAAGDLYVTTIDTSVGGGGGAIVKFTPNGSRSTFASGLDIPKGLAFDHEGDLLVVDNGSIFKFTPDGTKITFASGLSLPRGLAFDGTGNLFVTESFGDTGGITKITAAGSKSIFAYGGNFFSLAFDSLGNLFAASGGPLDPPLITRFTHDGKASNFAQFVTGDLALSRTGNLYVADYDRIYKFTPTGYQTLFASNLQDLEGLAFDSAGNLFVADSYGGHILKFTPTATKSIFASGLTNPIALAFEPILEKLRNISARGMVGTGDNLLIGGFILRGNSLASNAVIVRAIGPSLAKAGVAEPLQDPVLELHNSSGAILATNDNWQDTQQAQITATGLAPSDKRESAIFATLPAGNYTAVVRGAGETTGAALVEIYSVNQ